MRIVFAGTSDFGIPTLEAIKKSLVLIITQPDKPTGRQQTITPPPVKIWATKNNISVIQPEKITEAKEMIKNSDADLMLVAAYGQIIPKEILDIPKNGSVNIHGSLLPKYRGASPIQSAILDGEEVTGVTLFQMDEKMDHGSILERIKIPIEANEGFMQLYSRMAKITGEKIQPFLDKLFAGNILKQPQDETRATYTKLLTKEDGRIKWTMPAKSIHQQVLALNPEPGTWTRLDEKSVKILKTETLVDNKIELAGKLYRVGDNLAVKCSDYSLIVKELQPEGKKPMAGGEFLNGLRNLETKIFV